MQPDSQPHANDGTSFKVSGLQSPSFTSFFLSRSSATLIAPSPPFWRRDCLPELKFELWRVQPATPTALNNHWSSVHLDLNLNACLSPVWVPEQQWLHVVVRQTLFVFGICFLPSVNTDTLRFWTSCLIMFNFCYFTPWEPKVLLEHHGIGLRHLVTLHKLMFEYNCLFFGFPSGTSSSSTEPEQMSWRSLNSPQVGLSLYDSPMTACSHQIA